MALNYPQVTDEILKYIGGIGNISSATHCMTRLRLVLNDESKADDDKVKEIKGVKSVVHQGGQYQIIIGNEVSNLFKEFSSRGNFGGEEKATEKEKEPIFKRITGYVAGSFIPLLPAMLGGGMIKVILTLLVTFGLVSTESSTYIILNGMGDAFFYFMPILLASTTAKKVGATPIVAQAIAAALLYPNIMQLFSEGATGSFLGMPSTVLFGLPVIATTYSTSVLPVLLMAPIIKKVEDFADRVSPNLVKSFLKPLLTIFISGIIAFVVVGPIGGVAGNLMATGVNWLYTRAGWLTVTLIGAFFPFIVMTGMHYALFPIIAISLGTLGFDPIGGITMYVSNLAQGSTALAVAAKTKNKERKSEALASGISAVVAGVTEPALYGVTLQSKAATIAAIAGGFAGGLVAGIAHVVTYSMSGAYSVLAVIVMVGGEGMANLIFGIIAGVVSLIVAFVTAFILYKDKEEDQQTDDEHREKAMETITETDAGLGLEVFSPLTGKVVSLNDVPDAVFSSGALGEGLAVIPEEGAVYAPADGKVTVTMDSKHAVGLQLDGGIELLIHVGLDTVQLEGKYFENFVKEGDSIKKGDLLMKFDIDKIKEAGYPVITPVVISNSDEFSEIIKTDQQTVVHSSAFMKVQK